MKPTFDVLLKKLLAHFHSNEDIEITDGGLGYSEEVTVTAGMVALGYVTFTTLIPGTHTKIVRGGAIQDKTSYTLVTATKRCTFIAPLLEGEVILGFN
jgi:hypothetical protein